MKPSRLLTAIALLPLACVQGAQNAPPPVATATAAPPVAAPLASMTDSPPAPPPAVTSGTSAAKRETSQPAAAKALPQNSGPAEAPRRRLVVPEGTYLPIEIQTTLSSATSREGDPVLALLTEDVPLEGFKLDQGAEVRGRVRTAIAAKRVKGRAQLVLDFDAVMENGEKLSITTEAIDTMAASTSGRDKKIIAGGAVGGLILGAIKDGKKGAAVGTVIGAAAGTGAVLIMKGDEVEIPRGARLTIAVTK